MQFLFAQNDSYELKETKNRISAAIDKIEDYKYKHDTFYIDTTVVAIAFVSGLASVAHFIGSGGVAAAAIGIASLTTFISSMVSALYLDQDVDHGIIGGYRNRRWRQQNQQIVDAVPTLGQLCKRMEKTALCLDISKTVKDFYEKYGDNVTISISRGKKNDNLYCMQMSGQINETKDGLTITDSRSREYWLEEEFVDKTFRDGVADFSWLDGELDTVREDIKQLFVNTPKLLEEHISEV